MPGPISKTRHRARALARAVLVALLLSALAACAAPPTARDPATASIAPESDGVATGTPPRKSSPLPPERVSTPAPTRGNSPPRIDASCRVNADCVVKNVGNCCGEYPACVNAGSPTDPAAVQAACKASGRMAACGFRQIASCTCDQGTCSAQSEPVGDWINGSPPQSEPVR